VQVATPTLKSALWQRYQGDEIERTIVEMERNGFMIDVDFCNTQAAKAALDEAECLKKLRSWLASMGVPPLLGCDDIWSSPKQMVHLLHEHLKYPPSPIWKKGRVKIHKGERKTDEAALGWVKGRAPKEQRWGIDELIKLRRVRGCIKYLTKLPTFIAPDGFVHPVCGPAGDDDDRVGTITGRLAGKNPEFMQIPTNPEKDWYRIRKAFIAPPGHTLIVADYSALEVVILAHILIDLFGDHQLAEMVAPGAPDIHSVNARRVFDYLGWKVDGRPVGEYPFEAFKEVKGCKRLRQMIKEIWYGLMYGKSAFGFATSLRDADDNPIGEELAQKLVDALLDSVPSIRRFHAWCWEFIHRYKGMIGIGGRWCDLRELVEGDEWMQKRALRISENFPMQEGGAAIVGAAGVAISKDPTLRSAGLRTERQVHDEYNWRLPLTSDIEVVKSGIRHHMTTAFPLRVPLQVSIGTGANWEEAK